MHIKVCSQHPKMWKKRRVVRPSTSAWLLQLPSGRRRSALLWLAGDMQRPWDAKRRHSHSLKWLRLRCAIFWALGAGIRLSDKAAQTYPNLDIWQLVMHKSIQPMQLLVSLNCRTSFATTCIQKYSTTGKWNKVKTTTLPLQGKQICLGKLPQPTSMVLSQGLRPSWPARTCHHTGVTCVWETTIPPRPGQTSWSREVSWRIGPAMTSWLLLFWVCLDWYYLWIRKLTGFPAKPNIYGQDLMANTWTWV